MVALHGQALSLTRARESLKQERLGGLYEQAARCVGQSGEDSLTMGRLGLSWVRERVCVWPYGEVLVLQYECLVYALPLPRNVKRKLMH